MPSIALRILVSGSFPSINYFIPIKLRIFSEEATHDVLPNPSNERA
jgi:hypothetical protein